MLCPGVSISASRFTCLVLHLLLGIVHAVTYFADAPPDERLLYLRAVKGIEIERGEALFNIGDAADAFYCVMYGSLNVVLDFARMAAQTLSDFEEILNRARVHASLLNPGGTGGACACRSPNMHTEISIGTLTSPQEAVVSLTSTKLWWLCMHSLA